MIYQRMYLINFLCHLMTKCFLFIHVQRMERSEMSVSSVRLVCGFISATAAVGYLRNKSL